jgi:hypothetical protein
MMMKRNAFALTMALMALIAMTACTLTGGTTAEPPTGGTTAEPPTGGTKAEPPTAEPPTGGTKAEPPTAEPPTGGTKAEPPTAEPRDAGMPGTAEPPQEPTEEGGAVLPEAPEPEPQEDLILTPLGGHGPEEIFLSLSKAERDCIDEKFTPEERGRMLELAGTETRNVENASRMMQCAGEKTLLRVLITSIVKGPEPLTEQTSECIWNGFSRMDKQGMIRNLEADATSEGPQESGQIKDTLAGSMITLHCLNDEEWQRTDPDESMEADREMIACAVDEIGGTEIIRESMDAPPGEMSRMFELNIVCPPPPQDGG